jgi:formylglycine-generating enzyme required for sulfatase activity
MIILMLSVTALSIQAQPTNAKKLAVLEKAMQTALATQKPKPGEFYRCEIDGKATLAEFNHFKDLHDDYIFDRYDYQEKGLESHKWKLLWFEFIPAENFFYYVHKKYSKSDILCSELTNTSRIWAYNGDPVSALTTKGEKHTFFYRIPNVYWSGNVKNGLADGEGAGIVCVDKEYKSWYCVEGTFKEGFPVGEVVCRYIILTDNLVPNKNSVFKVTLSEFANGKATMTDSNGDMATITTDGCGTLLKRKEQPIKTKPTEKTTSNTARKQTKPSHKDSVLTVKVAGVTFKMVYVDGGHFMMGMQQGFEGIPDMLQSKRYIQDVTLSPYFIGETEVTQELWQAVMGSNPSTWKGKQRPVENVSWDDCQEFVTKLNQLTGKKFRLPTEAEWEFAARGGVISQKFRFSGSNNVNDIAWYWANSGDRPLGGEWDFNTMDANHCQTHDVKTKKPNELKLYDMSGNVSEWCEDRIGRYKSTPQTNPTGATNGSERVHRGGNWSFEEKKCTVIYRYSLKPNLKHETIGLRLAF